MIAVGDRDDEAVPEVALDDLVVRATYSYQRRLKPSQSVDPPVGVVEAEDDDDDDRQVQEQVDEDRVAAEPDLDERRPAVDRARGPARRDGAAVAGLRDGAASLTGRSRRGVWRPRLTNHR